MKKITLLAFFVAVVMTSVPLVGAGTQTQAFYGHTWSHSIFIDIGNDESEAPYSLIEWGTPVGAVSAYGGHDGDLRLIWGPGANDNTNWASISIHGTPELINIRHLAGAADDSFDIHINGVYIGHVDGSTGSGWTVTSVPVSGVSGDLTITFTVTADAWAYWYNWGQVAFDWIEIVMQGHEYYYEGEI